MHEKVVCVRTYFVWSGAKKKTNKFRRLSGAYILETTGDSFIKLGMLGRVYGPTKIYRFDRNRPNSSRATIG